MGETSTMPAFRAPSAMEALFNRAFGLVIGFGFGPAYIYLLEVRGRKSGRIYSTPVNLLAVDGRQYLVAPRGRTQWVRNAEAVGEVTLKKGSARLAFRVEPLPRAEKPRVLKAYLDTYARVVQRYFSVPAGSPVEAFAAIADNYPVFALLPL
jgi:deazaflavin-dependent oxidoreductase (nitroreductase family)